MKKEEEHCHQRARHQRMCSISSTRAEDAEYGGLGYRYEPSTQEIEQIQKNIKDLRREHGQEVELRKMYVDICKQFLERKKYKMVRVQAERDPRESFKLLRDYARDIAREIIEKMNRLIDYPRGSEQFELYTKISTLLGDTDKIQWVTGSLIHKAMHEENLIKEENKNRLRWGNGKIQDIEGAIELNKALKDRKSKRTRYFDKKHTQSYGVWNRMAGCD